MITFTTIFNALSITEMLPGIEDILKKASYNLAVTTILEFFSLSSKTFRGRNNKKTLKTINF